jgi:hypothetical protein
VPNPSTLQILLASSATAPQFAQVYARVSFGTGMCFFSVIAATLYASFAPEYGYKAFNISGCNFLISKYDMNKGCKICVLIVKMVLIKLYLFLTVISLAI